MMYQSSKPIETEINNQHKSTQKPEKKREKNAQQNKQIVNEQIVAAQVVRNQYKMDKIHAKSHKI